jgi:CubicO group peptidase (beta-lactamase class C family)
LARPAGSGKTASAAADRSAIMTRRKGLLAGLLSVFAAPACAAPTCPGFAGRWGGVLDVGPGLRLVLEVDAAGVATLVSVDQGDARIPATGGTCTDDALSLAFASVRGTLEVRRVAGGRLEGTWSQGRALPIVLSPLAGRAFPDMPARGPALPLPQAVAAARSLAAAPALGAAWARGAASGIAVDGVRAMGEPAAVEAADRWHVGSITKSMTATLVARLVEAGKLRWDMLLADALPDMAAAMQEQYRGATLLQLMQGRSGLPTNIPMIDFVRFSQGKRGSLEDRRAFAAKALAMKPEGGLGDSEIYPNNGYVVTGAVCEAATGQPWETLLRELVFAPLDMATAGFGPPPEGSPAGHRMAMIGGRMIPVGRGPEGDNPPAMGPAGTAHMSLADLARFGRIHAEGHVAGLEGFLTKESFEVLHTPLPGADYACGWVRRPDGTLWHNGSNTYWYAEVVADPEGGVGAASAMNRADPAHAVADALRAALAAART